MELGLFCDGQDRTVVGSEDVCEYECIDGVLY